MSFIGSFFHSEEMERLENLKNKFKTAKDLGKSECVKCGWCCNRRTCVPMPEEFKTIANYLNLSVKECLNKYFCIDASNGSNIKYVKPAGINQFDLLGKFIPDDRTYNEGKCVFLDDQNLCKIHIVKPTTAKILKCWEENNIINLHKMVVKIWERYYNQHHDLDFIKNSNKTNGLNFND